MKVLKSLDKFEKMCVNLDKFMYQPELLFQKLTSDFTNVSVNHSIMHIPSKMTDIGWYLYNDLCCLFSIFRIKLVDTPKSKSHAVLVVFKNLEQTSSENLTLFQAAVLLRMLI